MASPRRLAQIEDSDNRRRRPFTFGSSLIPIIGLGILVNNKQSAIFVSLACALPTIISLLCGCFFRPIRASRARNERILLVEILSPLLALTITGALAFISPHSHVGVAFYISCANILWAWMLEVTLGLTSQLGLINTTTALAVGFIRHLKVSAGAYVAFFLIPASTMVLLKTISYFFIHWVFPVERAEENAEEDQEMLPPADMGRLNAQIDRAMDGLAHEE